mgnify:CR=1 FL=1
MSYLGRGAMPWTGDRRGALASTTCPPDTPPVSRRTFSAPSPGTPNQPAASRWWLGAVRHRRPWPALVPLVSWPPRTRQPWAGTARGSARQARSPPSTSCWTDRSSGQSVPRLRLTSDTATTRRGDRSRHRGHAHLRHFFASGLIASGCDVVAVQRALGHAKASTTLRIYGHLWPKARSV